MTIDTLAVIKTLVSTYRTPLEHVLRIGWSELKEHPAPTILGSALLFLLSALEGNLESKASSYRPKTLQHIFLLNNLYYIQKQLKSDEYLRLLGGAFFTKVV